MRSNDCKAAISWGTDSCFFYVYTVRLKQKKKHPNKDTSFDIIYYAFKGYEAALSFLSVDLFSLPSA